MQLTTDNISIDSFKQVIEEEKEEYKIIKTNKKKCYYNIPCAFDIETSSFYDNDEKRGIMYEWTLGINGHIIIGRTWDEFMNVIEWLTNELNTTENRIIIYVHNLAFEFQFIRSHFEWEQVFSVKERTPVYARTTTGIEFRCSYILSGYSLKSVGEHLNKWHVEKLTGDLNYSLIRHSFTPMTEKECGYCINDVAVVMAYIDEEIDKNGDITRIPLTKTGYVRRYCRNACLYDGSHKKNAIKYLNYRAFMKHQTLKVDEYMLLKRAFQGGFTHANAFHVKHTICNVSSYDFTSSYPAVMVAEKFPITSGEKITIKSTEQFKRNIQYYCCVFDAEFINIRSVVSYEHYISRSRCFVCEEYDEDNGRIIQAKRLCTTITEQDYFIIRDLYEWDEIKIGTFYRYRRGYLPTEFVKSILDLYADKTTLKNVTGRENDYLLSKEMLNSCYGMTVTDICRNEIEFINGEWSIKQGDYNEQIEKYNKDPRRFLSYVWGVYVTAYARRNLFTAIQTIKDDYIYSDTDSVKIRNRERYTGYFERYNKEITEKIERALKFHALPLEMAKPKTIKGIEKPLGIWDYETTYDKFKTLGAKRYMIEEENALIVDFAKPTEKRYNISITVSGVNKTYAVPYILSKTDDPFTFFNDEMYIPPEYTGKMTHTYIDEEIHGTVTDYTGNSAPYNEKTCIHLENAEYTLSLSEKFKDYLFGIEEFTK